MALILSCRTEHSGVKSDIWKDTAREQSQSETHVPLGHGPYFFPSNNALHYVFLRWLYSHMQEKYLGIQTVNLSSKNSYFRCCLYFLVQKVCAGDCFPIVDAIKDHSLKFLPRIASAKPGAVVQVGFF